MSQKQKIHLDKKVIAKFINEHKSLFVDKNGNIQITEMMPATKIVGLNSVAKNGECVMVILNTKSQNKDIPSIQIYYVTHFLFLNENYTPTPFENVWRAYWGVQLEKNHPNLNYPNELANYLKKFRYKSLADKDTKGGLLSKLNKSPEETQYNKELKEFKKCYEKEKGERSAEFTKNF